MGNLLTKQVLSMKKNLFYLFALICSMSLFTACSDDDDAPDYSKVIESEIAGNYKGSLTVTVEGTTMPSEPQKIKRSSIN